MRDSLASDDVTRLISKWREDGVTLNPGANTSALDKLGQALSAPLPLDVAAFYGGANGMPDLACDES